MLDFINGVALSRQNHTCLKWNFYFFVGYLIKNLLLCGRCPVLGNTQGQVGGGSKQPDLVEDVLSHCLGIGLDDL